MKRTEAPFELEIDDLTLEGQGVGRHEGKACFVADALPGERVLVTPMGRKRNYDTARLERILRKSPDRVEPPCRWFGTCGGCRLMHLSVPAQRQIKEKTLFAALERLGKVQPAQRLPPIIDSDLGYRRTARLGVKYVARKGGTLVGFRERGGRYLADMLDCRVLHPAIGDRITILRELINGLELREFIPQIETVVDDTGLAALIFRHLRPLSDADQERLRVFAEIEGVQVFLQSAGPDSVLPLAGPKQSLLYGHPESHVEVQFTPLDFIQVHPEVNRQMVRQAIHWLAVDAESQVLDLYCGLGNFTLPLARQAGSVLGIEGDEKMLERARLNAQRQKIANTRYVQADLDQLDGNALPWSEQGFDRALLDPPRTGAAAAVRVIGDLAIPRLVYVSCNPATLARDAATLVHEYGYQLLAAGILDMFPHTAHVESMAVFVRDA